MIKRFILLFVSFFVASPMVVAANLYTVAAMGYSDMEYATTDRDGLGYKFALGYQFHQQWYVELGYQQLIKQDFIEPPVVSELNIAAEQTPLQGQALSLSFLGKASNHVGELYYRVGVLKAEFKQQALYVGQVGCGLVDNTDSEVLTVNETLTECGAPSAFNRDNGVAAVLGLGFDYFIGARTMLRSEIEYIKGQDELSMSFIAVGLRYNF